jgi:hypothetical protein
MGPTNPDSRVRKKCKGEDNLIVMTGTLITGDQLYHSNSNLTWTKSTATIIVLASKNLCTWIINKYSQVSHNREAHIRPHEDGIKITDSRISTA